MKKKLKYFLCGVILTQTENVYLYNINPSEIYPQIDILLSSIILIY